MDNPYKIAENILSSQQMTDAHFKSVDLYGSSVQEKPIREKECSVFHLENQSGTGDIAIYKAFPGMELVYNDMHAERDRGISYAVRSDTIPYEWP